MELNQMELDQMKTKNKVMTHIIAGYPDYEISLETAETLCNSGIAALEVQFPFSDPVADGPVIEKACNKALEKYFTVDTGFAFVKRITQKYSIPVFVMTYASLPFARGMEKFVSDSADAGACGLIIPDLPHDYDEELYQLSKKYSIECVPVVVPLTEKKRLKEILDLKTRYVYAALRSGTTGVATEIDSRCMNFLKEIKKSGCLVMAGFGIRNRTQIEALGDLADYYIVGSQIVSLIDKNQDNQTIMNKTISDYIKTLL